MGSSVVVWVLSLLRVNLLFLFRILFPAIPTRLTHSSTYAGGGGISLNRPRLGMVRRSSSINNCGNDTQTKYVH